MTYVAKQNFTGPNLPRKQDGLDKHRSCKIFAAGKERFKYTNSPAHIAVRLDVSKTGFSKLNFLNLNLACT